jgi:hypothetical protein
MKHRLLIVLFLSLSCGSLIWAQSDSSTNAASAYTGPPPTPNMSPEDAQAYFAQALDGWLKAHPSAGASASEYSHTLSVLAPAADGFKNLTFDVNQVGLDNLLAILCQAPPTRGSIARPIMWRQVALDNIQKLALDGDLPKIMSAAKRTPLLVVVMRAKGWAGKPEVDQFLKDELDVLDQSHATDMSGMSWNIFELAAQSANPDVIEKLLDVIHQAAESTETSSVVNAFRIQLLKAILTTQDQKVQSAVPVLLSSIAHEESDSLDLRYQFASEVDGILDGTLDKTPVVFLFKTSEGRQAIDELTAPLVEAGSAKYEFLAYQTLELAMKAGNKKAFDQLADQIKNPTSHQTAGALAGLVESLVYNGPGDKAHGASDHSDIAVFNPDLGKWTITVPGYTAEASGTSGNPIQDNNSSAAVTIGATADGVSHYADKLLNEWETTHPDQKTNSQPPCKELSQSLHQFGLESLLLAYGQIPDFDVNAGADEVFKGIVIYFAIKTDATDANLPLLINAATKDQRLIPLILDKQQWRQNPQVIQFAESESDKINELTLDRPAALLSFDSRSEDKSLQSKLLNMARNPGNYNGRAIEGLLKAVLSSNDVRLLQTVPDLLKAAAPQMVDSGVDPTKTHAGAIAYLLAEKLMGHPQLCADKTVQSEGNALLQTMRTDWEERQATQLERINVLGASIGDMGDFQAVIRRLDKRSRGETNVTNSGDNMDKPVLIDLDQSFFNTVIFNGPGDKLTGVIGSLAAAKFDPDRGCWVVNGPGSKPLSPLPPPAAEAQLGTHMDTNAATVAPSTAKPPLTPDPPSALPASAIPSAPQTQTGTITSATEITTTTSNGGHAAMPLDVGEKVTILSVNDDGTVTAVNSVNFRGQLPRTAVSINTGSGPHQ